MERQPGATAATSCIVASCYSTLWALDSRDGSILWRLSHPLSCASHRTMLECGCKTHPLISSRTRNLHTSCTDVTTPLSYPPSNLLDRRRRPLPHT